MRLAPIAAAMVAGMTVSAAAQFMAPGMPPPGYSQPQQQMPPCFNEFAPLKAEAEKRGLAVKGAIDRKAGREEACTLIKRYSEAEAKMLKYIVANASACGIPAEAAAQMKSNHGRTLKTVTQVCSTAGPARPTGPGLSEALGTTRSGSILDPTAPQSGTLDTLTGNVLAK